MSTMQEKAAEAKAKMEKQNPANPQGQKPAMDYVPLSLPMQKLQVPDIPGFHLHWFRGTSARIQAAQRAGYVFVRPDEVQLNDLSIGGDASRTGNTDLGDRVSVVAGDVDDRGDAVRLYLMKQPLELWLKHREHLHQRNDSIAEALTASYKGGLVGGRAAGETAEDAGQRYVDRTRTKVPDMFKKKPARR